MQETTVIVLFIYHVPRIVPISANISYFFWIIVNGGQWMAPPYCMAYEILWNTHPSNTHPCQVLYFSENDS